MGFFSKIMQWGQNGKDVEPAPVAVANVLTGGAPREGIDTNSEEGQRLAYDICAPVRAIIDYKVLAAQEARFRFLDRNGEEVEAPKEFERLKMMNARQTLIDVVANAEFFVQLFGIAYIVRIMPIGIRKIDAASFYVLPPSKVQPVYDYGAAPSFDLQNYVKRYTVTLPNGSTITMEPGEVFPIRDTSGWEHSMNGVSVTGCNGSRLSALSDEVNAYVVGYDAVADLMKHRGMLGLLSLDLADPTDAANVTVKDEVDKLQERLRSKYGTGSNQYKVAISKVKANYVEMSSKLTDLGIPPILQGAKDEMAYVYGVPSVLLDVQGTTYDNFAKARVSFFVNTIRPEVANICRTITAAVELPDGLTLDPYFDHLPDFKDSKRQHAQGLSEMAKGLAKLLEAGVISKEQAQQQFIEYID